MKSGFYRVLAVMAACLASPWASWHQRRIRKHGRSLTLKEEGYAHALDLKDCDRIFICEMKRVPNPLYPLLCLLQRCGASCITRAAGITLGHGIYVSTECAHSPELIAHELVHVGQYQRAGSIWSFMVEYIHQCLLHGYFDAAWEEEARKKSLRILNGQNDQS